MRLLLAVFTIVCVGAPVRGQVSFNGLEFPASRQDFLRVFGSPDSIVAEYDPEFSDSIWTYHYKYGSFNCYYLLDAHGRPKTSVDLQVWIDSLPIRNDGWKITFFGHALSPKLTYSSALNTFRKYVLFKQRKNWITLREDEILVYDLNFQKGRLVSIVYEPGVNPP
jgi:hypothetical protein